MKEEPTRLTPKFRRKLSAELADEAYLSRAQSGKPRPKSWQGLPRHARRVNPGHEFRADTGRQVCGKVSDGMH
jgi:hypothetical protein